WAAAVGRRPVAFGLLAVIVMVTLAVPALGMRTWPQDSGAQSTELTTRRAHDILVDEYGPGANSQILIVAPTDTVSGAELASATARITSIPGVAAVSAPAISPDGELAVISVTSAYDPAADGTPEMLAAVRSALPQGAILTGATTYFSDISDKLQERLWVVIGFVVAASVLALMVLFRSIAVPIKAALMNLLSVVAAYGVITAVFQWGWGMQLFGLDHTVAVSSWVPILIFAILFGLSMDYEVFLLSRIREDWLATGDAKGSVVRGLARTGRVITSAAAIMVAVFLSFATEADVVLKMLGLGMATAVLLDATLIRMVLVPATMTLLGRFNWWLPGWLDRILPNVDVEGHGHPTPSVEQQTVRPTATEDPDGELQPV
ncbi:MMPL family transporter, partial [Gordonia sp. NPDC003585]